MTMTLSDPQGDEPMEGTPNTAKQANWIALAAFVLAFLAFLVGGLRSYGSDSSALEHRLSVVETQQQNANQRMERMENKIDRILERVQ